MKDVVCLVREYRARCFVVSALGVAVELFLLCVSLQRKCINSTAIGPRNTGIIYKGMCKNQMDGGLLSVYVGNVNVVCYRVVCYLLRPLILWHEHVTRDGILKTVKEVPSTLLIFTVISTEK